MGDDLSEFERRRLENIKRNEAFLSSLGLNPVKKALRVDAENKEKKEANFKRNRDARQKGRTSKSLVREQPTRCSKRLRSQPADDVQDDSATAEDGQEEEDGPIDYSQYPQVTPTVADARVHYGSVSFDTHQSSDQLDDFEFQCYAKLRKWRLMTHRELEIEPFKVFQNRTLCELVRRRRNDPNWARESARSTEDSTEDEASQKAVSELLMCWGVGPSKVRHPDGFALQAVEVLNDAEVTELLKSSVVAASAATPRAVGNIEK